ncbi:unnamed protein product, partial [Tetraodon nigroviridis]
SDSADRPGTGDADQRLQTAAQAEAPKPKGISAVAVLWTFGKCLGALLPVYLAGYYRVSTSLLVCGMMVYTGWKHARDAKEARLRSAIQLEDSEDGGASRQMSRIKRELPAWVNFPDVEKVEWLNKVLQQVWPFVGQYLEKLLVETIAPSIRASSTHLQTFGFTKVDMGDKVLLPISRLIIPGCVLPNQNVFCLLQAMKVVGIKAHTENDKGQVLLDLYISFVGNVEINVEVKRYFCKAGVKGMQVRYAESGPLKASSPQFSCCPLLCLQLHGMMRVILEPLIGDVPIVGAVSMFFIKRPKLDINWTGLTNLLDIPGLNVMSDSMIMDAIASCLVLPNRLVVPLVQGLHVAQLRSPLPRGVVRIYLLEAQNLAAKDNYVKGVMAGLSDPYAIMRVGPQHFTSKHVDNTNSPKWNETYEVIVHEVPGQELEVEVYDKDPDQDDFLGRTTLDLGTVKKSIVVDEWFTLKDTESGRVHFRLEWLSLLPGTDHLEQILKRNESITSKAGDPPSSAILVVYVDKAEELPTKKGNKEPNPLVQLSVQDTKRESKRGGSADRVQGLGSLTIPLSRLLSTSDLSLDQWFQLDKSGSASRIYVKAVLRVNGSNTHALILLNRLTGYRQKHLKEEQSLAIKTMSISIIPQVLWLDEERVSSNVASDLEAGVSKQLPQQTSPHPSFATEGLLRIHLLAGQNLIPKDNFMGGMVKGKSDPYVKINIGGETFTSQVIKGNLNPTWNEMYEVILTQLPGQELHLEVFDYDMDMKDDFMGRYSYKEFTGNIKFNKVLKMTFTLTHPEKYRLKISLKDIIDSQYNDQVLQFYSKQSFQNKAVPSAVRDPTKDVLVVKLSHNWALPVGSLVVPVKQLLSEPELILDQWLNLDGASPESQILLRAELKGLVRIILLEAQSLIAKDNMMGGMVKGKSDPYAKISVGEFTFKSSVIKENLNPVWNEMYEVVLKPESEQVQVKIELFDKDVDKDDFLGRYQTSLTVQQWYTLNDVKSGRVRLILEWVQTISHNATLEQVMQMQSLQSFHNKAVPAAALLFVLVEQANSLPLKKSGKEPKAGAELVCGNTTYRTKVCDRSRSPIWSEAFHFLVHDPREEMLIIKLSSAWDQPMGSLVVPVRQLLSKPQLVLDEWMPLDGASPDSEILLRAELKILNTMMIEAPQPAMTDSKKEEVKFSPDRTLKTPNEDNSDLSNLAHATVTGLPAETVGPAEIPQAGEVLPRRTAPGLNFGKEGVLRIHLLEAQNLVAKDNLMGGMVKGKSDPYVKISIGGAVFKSHVIKENLNPTWNEMYELVLNGHTDHEIKIEAYDKDLDNDDFLGRFSVRLNEVIRSQYTDQWYTLNDVKSGKVHLILEWVPAVSHPARLDQVLQLQALQSFQNKAAPAAALLFVYVDRAHSLPLCDRSTSPQWNESFYFLVHDPKHQMLIVKLSSGWDQPMGSLVISVKSLLAEPQLLTDQWFRLDGALPDSQVLLRAELKILDSKMVDMISSGTLPCTAPIWGSGNGRGLLPQSKDGVDSYVSLLLLPDKNKATKKKTAVKKRDHNPEYNERFRYDLPPDELRFRRLSVTVKNNSASFRSRDVIGQVQIELAQVDLTAGVTDWFTLRDDDE